MAQPRSISVIPLVGALAGGLLLAGAIGWWLNLRFIHEQIGETRAALKKSRLSGGVPPNQEVMDYLTSRHAALEQRYRDWLEVISAPPLAEAASADPQLYFQEQFHEVQRTLERFAAARGMAVPEQLGFPKELPPSDTVPRLLVQLSLIREAAELILKQGVSALSSLKIEDPQTVPETAGGEPFLTRLPVRVRLTASLPELMKVIGTIERARPLIDVRAIHLVNESSSGPLEVELLLARYLVAALSQEPLPAESAERSPQKKPAVRAASRASRQAGAASKRDDE